jgi:peptidoglycan hydrolase-like protein with peptidoglycan-binding domain
MFGFSARSILALGLALIVTPAFAASSQHSHKSSKSSTVRRVGHRIRHRIAHPLGQRGIAPERATQIQTALIRENYLTGSPSGQWDSETEAAMQKYQAAHGWQTRLTPDSRALIALGLGPSTASGPQTLPANTYSAPSPEPAEAGTLASVHSISQ